MKRKISSEFINQLANDMIGLDLNEHVLDSDELIALSTSMHAMRSVLLSKMSEALTNASKLDPNNYVPHLHLAKHYTFDRPNKILALEHLTMAKEAMKETPLDHPAQSDVDVIEKHWAH